MSGDAPTLAPVAPLLKLDAFRDALATVDNIVDLKHAHDQLAALRSLAKRFQLDLEAQNQIAELRIQTARKAGRILADTVHRGGKPSGGSAAPLPKGISWNQSSRWQALAKIPESALIQYLDHARGNHREVTVAGFLRWSSLGDETDDSVHFLSETPEWYTPRHIIEAVLEVMGEIDLDPCADPDRAVPARRHFTYVDDGLTKRWEGKVYMNPPYGSALPRWAAMLVNQFSEGSVTEAVALVPARTDTKWFRLFRAFPRCFVRGRLRFSGHKNSAPFPSMTVYLGPNSDAFASVFAEVGDIYVRLTRKPT